MIWGACAAVGVLLVGSLLPIWVAWHFNPWEGVGYRAALPQALAQVPANARDVGSFQALWELHLANLVQGAILLAVASLIGGVVYWMVSRRRTKG